LLLEAINPAIRSFKIFMPNIVAMCKAIYLGNVLLINALLPLAFLIHAAIKLSSSLNDDRLRLFL
jgi:hypothetical protein